MLALAAAATADSDAAAIWRQSPEGHRHGRRMFAADLIQGAPSAGSGEARLEVGRVADVRWLAVNVRYYDMLVRRRG